jgi:hypothetical protein
MSGKAIEWEGGGGGGGGGYTRWNGETRGVAKPRPPEVKLAKPPKNG